MKEKSKTGNQKKETIFQEKNCNWIFWCFSFHETKAIKKDKERKRQKQETKRKQKRKTRRKVKRKEQQRDRERETEKGGGQKRLREKERETLKINKKCPFLGGKQVFVSIKKTKKAKQRKKRNQKKQKENKEGLGPSEVALWATSPDP